ncbi:hypothetical protein DL98DRAFT_176909 [Cadophora sp. DSE1049]|nr:hypothetical protein DL98DRAFT_176909 [Cadophora sp. DSE1049]
MAKSRYLKRPGLFKAAHDTTIPWGSVGLLAISIISIIAAGVTLRLLENQTTSHWYSQPAIILAVISSVFNVSTSVATTFGVAVLWWRAASQGTQVRNLHLIWDRGMGVEFFSAFMGDSKTRRTAIAALVVAVARFSSGPLLQRAVGQTGDLDTRMIPLKLWFAETLPSGKAPASFFRENETELSFKYNGPSAPYLRRFELNDDEGYFNGRTTQDDLLKQCPPHRPGSCGGLVCPRNSTCTASVKGVGLSMNCSADSYQVDLRSPASQGVPLFHVAVQINNDTDRPGLWLSTIFNNHTSDDCIADIVVEACDIRTVMVNYHVSMKWGNITHLGHRGFDPEQPYLSPKDKFNLKDRFIGQRYECGPLGSLFTVFSQYYDTTARLSTNNLFDSPGFGSQRFQDGANSDNDVCANTFRRPAALIYSKMSQYLFLALQLSGAQTEAYQNISATEEYPVLVHHLDRTYVAASLVVMVVGVLAVAALFWGFWELERSVTLSPVETAKALGAPLLATGPDVRIVDEVLERTGWRRIRYDGRVFRGDGGSVDGELEGGN